MRSIIKIRILGRKETTSPWVFQSLRENCPAPLSIISVTYPGGEHPKYPHVPQGATPILRMSFWDITDRKYPGPQVPITPEQGEEIARFLHDVYGGQGTLVCQCDAGISRSAGTALAASTLFRAPPEVVQEIVSWPHRPNLLVRDIIIQAWGRLYRDCASCESFAGHYCTNLPGLPDKSPGGTCDFWDCLYPEPE